ncbi:CLUMA_CG021473, isoform A [Clunio marinus]|uniref:CLUMA_CG021473, isoform A n=1 Tax=Clunio marinus TaxID=568069 RepID=A0A1J1JAJ1_9DIPT|nr:CLUMA_CG021473, isoform A [Clunio marinus]
MLNKNKAKVQLVDIKRTRKAKRCMRKTTSAFYYHFFVDNQREENILWDFMKHYRCNYQRIVLEMAPLLKKAFPFSIFNINCFKCQVTVLRISDCKRDKINQANVGFMPLGSSKQQISFERDEVAEAETKN